MKRILTTPKGERIPLSTVRRLIAEQKPEAIEQPALFELKVDSRPLGDRNAAERYLTPNLFTWKE